MQFVVLSVIHNYYLDQKTFNVYLVVYITDKNKFPI